MTNKNPSAPPPSLLEYFNAAQGAYAVADAAVFEGRGPAPSGLHVVENSVHFIFGERCSCHPICAIGAQLDSVAFASIIQGERLFAPEVAFRAHSWGP